MKLTTRLGGPLSDDLETRLEKSNVNSKAGSAQVDRSFAVAHSATASAAPIRRESSENVRESHPTNPALSPS
jgi:hypothetical protein